MEEQIKTCGDKKWDNMEEIEEHIKSLNGFYVVGYISEETARKWNNRVCRKLWVVSLGSSDFVLCLSNGMFNV